MPPPLTPGFIVVAEYRKQLRSTTRICCRRRPLHNSPSSTVYTYFSLMYSSAIATDTIRRRRCKYDRDCTIVITVLRSVSDGDCGHTLLRHSCSAVGPRLDVHRGLTNGRHPLRKVPPSPPRQPDADGCRRAARTSVTNRGR